MNNNYAEPNQELWGWLHIAVCILGFVLAFV